MASFSRLSFQQEHVPSELEIQMEVERLMVKEFAEERQLSSLTLTSVGSDELQDASKQSSSDRSLRNASDRSFKKGAKKWKKPKYVRLSCF
jgi:hypothetical protein